ncbi:MAG: hypothetical protein U0Q16_29540 [Bryobacteraceae bacterium]
MLLALLLLPSLAFAALRAGTGRADITDRDAGPVNDPSYVKALALDDGATRAVVITIDVVALAEIGRLDNGFMARIRAELERDPGIPARNVIANASHTHSIIRRDTDKLTVQAVREAWRNLTPVRAGAGRGHEDRISENRRMYLKSGAQADMRRAYSMPRDQDVASTGPIDPEIGLLRFDRLDGKPLAVVYNFAAHPIMAVPNGGNTADYPAFASRAIEENLGDGVLAFFIQGCGGDINPAKYKDTHVPHDAEPLGNRLGLAALRAVRNIRTRDTASFRLINETLTIPRAADFEQRMSAVRAKLDGLVKSLQGTNLNFKTFLELYVQQKLAPDAPAYYVHRYQHEKAVGLQDLAKMDADNRADVAAYLRNIETMEEITRLQTNLALLEKHHAEAAGRKTMDVEVVGLRIGDFNLVTFPGELTVEIGLGIKKRARAPFTFVAGYTNGYLYYTATAEQRKNSGYAQEDCDVMVAPEWQAIFESKAESILGRLAAQ